LYYNEKNFYSWLNVDKQYIQQAYRRFPGPKITWKKLQIKGYFRPF